MIGSFQPLQQVAAAFRRYLRLHEPIERSVLEAIEILRVLPGVLHQTVATEQRSIELGRQIRPSVHGLALMVELQIQRALQKIQRLLGVVGIREQGLPVLDLQNAGCVVVTLNPRLHQLVDAIELLESLKMQTVVIVEILRARNELLEGFRAVLGQRKVFDVADFLRLRSAAQHDQYAPQSQCLVSHDSLSFRLTPRVVSVGSLDPEHPHAPSAGSVSPRASGKSYAVNPRMVTDRDTDLAD